MSDSGSSESLVDRKSDDVGFKSEPIPSGLLPGVPISILDVPES